MKKVANIIDIFQATANNSLSGEIFLSNHFLLQRHTFHEYLNYTTISKSSVLCVVLCNSFLVINASNSFVSLVKDQTIPISKTGNRSNYVAQCS